MQTSYTDDTVGSQKVDFLMRTEWRGKRGWERAANESSDAMAERSIGTTELKGATLSTTRGIWDAARATAARNTKDNNLVRDIDVLDRTCVQATVRVILTCGRQSDVINRTNQRCQRHTKRELSSRFQFRWLRGIRISILLYQSVSVIADESHLSASAHLRSWIANKAESITPLLARVRTASTPRPRPPAMPNLAVQTPAG